MTDELEFLDKIKNGAKNVRPSQLRKLMRLFGFEEKAARHQYVFMHSKHRGVWASMAKHKEKGRENKVFEKYVRNCINAIEEVRLLEGGRNEKERG